jgi:hypothetical protein
MIRTRIQIFTLAYLENKNRSDGVETEEKISLSCAYAFVAKI